MLFLVKEKSKKKKKQIYLCSSASVKMISCIFHLSQPFPKAVSIQAKRSKTEYALISA